jgi:hypothetical protein
MQSNPGFREAGCEDFSTACRESLDVNGAGTGILAEAPNNKSLHRIKMTSLDSRTQFVQDREIILYRKPGEAFEAGRGRQFACLLFSHRGTDTGSAMCQRGGHAV